MYILGRETSDKPVISATSHFATRPCCIAGEHGRKGRGAETIRHRQLEPLPETARCQRCLQRHRRLLLMREKDAYMKLLKLQHHKQCGCTSKAGCTPAPRISPHHAGRLFFTLSAPAATLPWAPLHLPKLQTPPAAAQLKPWPTHRIS